MVLGVTTEPVNRRTGVAVVVGMAALAGLALPLVLHSVPFKLMVLLFGVLTITLLGLLTGQPRRVFLFILIFTLPLQVETNLGFKVHIGGAVGLTITAQTALLVPLLLIAIFEYVGEAEHGLRRLPAGALLMPLVPLLATLPSFTATHDLALSSYELARYLFAYGLYLYFVLAFRVQDLPLVVVSLMLALLLQFPFSAIELVKPNFQPAIFGQTSASTLELLAGGASSVRRVAGTLLHPNVLASFLDLVLPVALLLGMSPLIRPRLRALGWLSFLAGVVMLVLTYSRGGWIGFAVALALVLGIGALRGHISRERAAFTLIGMALAALAVTLSPPVLGRLLKSNPENLDFRLQINHVALSIFQAHWLKGVGLNTFIENAQAFDFQHVAVLSGGGFVVTRHSIPSLPVHNIYFLWLAETGLIGAAGMGVFLIWAGYRCWKAAAVATPLGSLLATGLLAGAVALYIGEVASFSTRFDAIFQAIFIFLGILINLSARGQREPSEKITA